MTVEEMKAKGKSDGRRIIEEAREGKDRDVSTYLAFMLNYRDSCQAMLEVRLDGEAGTHNLTLAVAYANGALSCFD